MVRAPGSVTFANTGGVVSGGTAVVVGAVVVGGVVSGGADVVGGAASVVAVVIGVVAGGAAVGGGVATTGGLVAGGAAVAGGVVSGVEVVVVAGAIVVVMTRGDAVSLERIIPAPTVPMATPITMSTPTAAANANVDMRWLPLPAAAGNPSPRQEGSSVGVAAIPEVIEANTAERSRSGIELNGSALAMPLGSRSALRRLAQTSQPSMWRDTRLRNN